jgi:hypothetical protein
MSARDIYMRYRIAAVVSLLLCSIAWGQAPSPGSTPPASQASMPGMDMPGDKQAESDASAHVMSSMEGHMDMGPHMKMTALRSSRPDDAARAQKVADEARKAAEKYMDYHVALAEGFQIFHPEIPQKMYHFTNYRWAFEARKTFDPAHPTSLLYEKHGDGYKLIGAMYTAPKRFTEDDLDERVPLSVAQWHEHVNFCKAPGDQKADVLSPRPQFGLRGSIATREACDAAGGTFYPVVFNWMVHVYPFEKDPAKIWSAERQHGDGDE